jgi:hypothetical protein
MKEVGKRPFSAESIADQQNQKIKRFVASEATSHQPDLMGEGLKQSFRCEVLGKDDHFGNPWRN